jgi:hypothetical protein
VYPQRRTQGDIAQWLTGLFMSYRGMDMGGFSNSVWASAWKKQSARWPIMSKIFVRRVILVIHRFFNEALNHVCPDPRIRDQLWFSLREQVLHRYQTALEAAEKLVSAERDGKPYTLDQHFNKRRQQARVERLVRRLKKNVHPYNVNVSETTTVTYTQIRSITEKKDNVEDVVEVLHDDLKAYYDIARRRFTDSLLNQVVNYQLLFGPPEVTPLGVFSQDWVIDLTPEQLETIAGEKPSVRDTREKLMRTIANLKEARNILR